MGTTLELRLQGLLASLPDPFSGVSFGRLAEVYSCKESDQSLEMCIRTSYPFGEGISLLRERIEAHVREYANKRTVNIHLEHKITAAKVQGKLRPLAEVRNIIAVASAKGGVGKSTVAVNLALGLSALGAHVGLLDGDIYGPSQQMMLGVAADARPKTRPPNYLVPIEAHNLQSMSLGYLLTQQTPLVWRGPMVSGALQQMVQQTLWKDLDYLIVDLPPGTGDIQLTLAQKVPVSGVVIVTTPQELALMDARRGAMMFRKVKVPVLGLVENMAYYLCKHCGDREDLFGSGGGARLAEECEIPLLGSLPLETSIRTSTDGGTPIVVGDPESASAQLFVDIARHVAALVAAQPRAGGDMRLDVRNITDAMA